MIAFIHSLNELNDWIFFFYFSWCFLSEESVAFVYFLHIAHIHWGSEQFRLPAGN